MSTHGGSGGKTLQGDDSSDAPVRIARASQWWQAFPASRVGDYGRWEQHRHRNERRGRRIERPGGVVSITFTNSWFSAIKEKENEPIL